MSLEEHERSININALYTIELVFPVCVAAKVQGLDSEHHGCFALSLSEPRDLPSSLSPLSASVNRMRVETQPAFGRVVLDLSNGEALFGQHDFGVGGDFNPLDGSAYVAVWPAEVTAFPTVRQLGGLTAQSVSGKAFKP